MMKTKILPLLPPIPINADRREAVPNSTFVENLLSFFWRLCTLHLCKVRLSDLVNFLCAISFRELKKTRRGELLIQR